MFLGSPARLLSRERAIGREEVAPEPKVSKSTDEKKNPQVVVINTNNDKLKKKIDKIETIKRKKIGKNQKPSELLKYYDYLSYEYPKLVAKNLASEDSDLVSSIKNAFEDKPEDTNQIEVKTSSFVDVGLRDKLRRDLIDTETKLDVDRSLREEMARKVKKEERMRLRSETKKAEAIKAEEAKKAREITGKLKTPTSIFKELDYPEASKPKRASDKRTVDIGDGMTLTTKSSRGRKPLALTPPMYD